MSRERSHSSQASRSAVIVLNVRICFCSVPSAWAISTHTTTVLYVLRNRIYSKERPFFRISRSFLINTTDILSVYSEEFYAHRCLHSVRRLPAFRCSRFLQSLSSGKTDERRVRINDKFLTRARLVRGGNIHGSWTHPGQLPSRAACTNVARPQNTHPCPMLAHFHPHGCRRGGISASFESRPKERILHEKCTFMLFAASQRHLAWDVRCAI
jgi:hypothetical protein